MSITIVSAFNEPTYIAKDYIACARRFMYSLRRNGGKVKDVPVILWVENEVKPSIEVVNDLENTYGAKIIGGDGDIKGPSSYGSWFQKCNAVKDAKLNTTHGLWLDIDYYFMGDFSEMLDYECDIAASPMNFLHNFGSSSTEDKMWDSYYKYFKLTRPDSKIRTAIDRLPGNFYFTSSVILYNNTIDFGNKYRDLTFELFNSGLPFCEKRHSQTSIPLLIVKYGWKYKVIPIHLSYMYNLNDYNLLGGDKDPVLVHYCDNRIEEVSDGDWNMEER